MHLSCIFSVLSCEYIISKEHQWRSMTRWKLEHFTNSRLRFKKYVKLESISKILRLKKIPRQRTKKVINFATLAFRNALDSHLNIFLHFSLHSKPLFELRAQIIQHSIFCIFLQCNSTCFLLDLLFFSRSFSCFTFHYSVNLKQEFSRHAFPLRCFPFFRCISRCSCW